MGLPIDPLTPQQVVNGVMEAVFRGEGGVIATPNLEHLRQHQADAEVRALYEQVDLSLADGIPLVWACRIQGTPLPGRVAGSDLTELLAESAATTGASLYLLGGDPGVAEQASRVLRRRYPGVQIRGEYCPPYGFETDAAELARVKTDLSYARPDIVYLGLSFPRSLRVALMLSRDFPQMWFIGVGISLSFISGDVRRAPTWARKAGLEWAHRLLQEPRRLARRYLLDGLPFGARVMAHARAARRSHWHP